MIQVKVIVNKLNRRKGPITDFADRSNIIGSVSNGYLFTSDNQVTNSLGTWYADRDGYYYWSGGVTVLGPVNVVSDNLLFNALPTGKAAIPSPSITPKELPVNQTRCRLTAEWLDKNFGDKCQAAIEGSPFTKELLYAIACQETAIYFYDWTKDHTPSEVLGRCVFDASGDANGTRQAFPKNTSEFVSKYGQQIADELIEEANKTRAMRGFAPKQWVYAGYGIFQYDIQYIQTDEAFFTQKQWYNIDDCVAKVMKELNGKWKAHPNDLFQTVKAYNGSGPRAENYANNVFQFLAWIRS